MDRSNEQMLTYAQSKGLGNPDLNCALSGMQTVEMVEQNTALASESTHFSKEEWEELGRSMEQLKIREELKRVETILKVD